MTAIAVADIGGTHARFAVADIEGGTIRLGEAVTLKTADYAGFAEAWTAFVRAAGHVPRAAAIAAAGPLRGGRIALTNARWVIDAVQLGLERVTLLNDFAAVAHAAARVGEDDLAHLAGPDRPLSAEGTVTVLGPGTGLGVAAFRRDAHGVTVLAGEGGHVGFAPQDAFEDRLLARLREEHPRVVAEHVVAGPGIAAIHAELSGGVSTDDRGIWAAIGTGKDALSEAAAERFCAALGSAAGDYAMVHGADAVVLAGGLAGRLREHLPRSLFASRFAAKPRYEAMMADIPIKLLTLPQPGLLGAAAAFAAEHGDLS